MTTDPLFEPYQPPDYPYPASVFTRHDDGSVTVDRFYPRQMITPELLGYSAGGGMMETRITITCANAKAVYRVIGVAVGGRTLVCELVDKYNP